MWQIANSEPAPKFEVVSRPNEWAKTVKRQSDSGELSEGKLKQLNFWTQLNEYAEERTKQIKLQNGRPQHWLNLAVGNSESHMAFWMDSRKGILGLQLYIPDNKELYKRICEDKDMIEDKIGKIEFHDTKGKAAFVAQYYNNFNIDNQADYEKYFAWLIERAVAFDKLFRPLLKTYLSEL